jgi:hypothetical protein
VIVGARLVPTVLAHFTARTAVDGQQTDEPIDPDRPSNLHAPVDDREAWAASGEFDHRSGGVLDPSFLRSLPSTAAALGRAAVAAARSKLGARTRRRQMEQRVLTGSDRRPADSTPDRVS